MPGAYTHYIISRQAVSLLGFCELKTAVSKHQKLYSLGAQGPDIFFYYVPISRHSDRRNIGSVMHEKASRLFLENAVRGMNLLSGGERGEAAAYIAGFVSHYICDSICHPYIYSRIDFHTYQAGHNRYLMHGKLEKQIDRLLSDSCPEIIPKDFSMKKAVSPSEEEMAFLSSFLPEAVNKTYFQDLRGHHFRLTAKMTERTVHYFSEAMDVRSVSERSGTFYDPSWVLNRSRETWRNPWDPSVESNASFSDLIAQTLRKCSLCFRSLDGCLCPGGNEEEDALAYFLHTAGNLSYHSGLQLP